MDNAFIKQRLKEQFGESLTNFEEPFEMLTFEAPKDLNLKIMRFLYDDPELRFQFLTISQQFIIPITRDASWLSFIICII